MRFGFGQNWANFIEHNFSEERVVLAQRHLMRFLRLDDLVGKTFVDIGCGSGIHSLGALRAGASEIISFDYDKDSVATTQKLKEISGNPPNWHVMEGSVLDKEFLDTLQRGDIVYSWGVLHHTGQMWQAIENAASLMKDDAVFYIALYTSDVYIDPTPEYWLRIKRQYNQAGTLRKRAMEWSHAWRSVIKPELLAGRNPLKPILAYGSYGQARGMSFWTDIRDWLGGWPMEFASIAETKIFCADKLGLELINISAGEGNTEYLLRRRGQRNYWDDFAVSIELEPLERPFAHRAGKAWTIDLHRHAGTCDDSDHPRRSRLMLFEDRVPLGFAHAPHAHIEAYGNGRFSHWVDSLIFSASDGSDPNTNGRSYAVCPDML